MNRYSRRGFLSSASKTALVLPLMNTMPWTSAALPAASDNAEEPIFRFLQMNDLHVQSDTSRYNKKIGATYKGANERASWLLESLRNETVFAKPDFVMAVGDMIHGEQLEGIKYDMDYFHRNIYSSFPVPLYPAVGNHEVMQQEGDETYQAPYVQLFGKDKLHYDFVHKGIHFVVCNNAGTWSVKDDGIIQDRISSFRKMMDNHPELPKIVCCHIPLIPVRDKEILAKSFGFPSFYTKEQEMLDIVSQKKDKVLAVLSGHLHITGVVLLDSVYHISLSGLASYPHDMAQYTIYSDRIEAEVIRLPSDLLEPSTNIHGAIRFGIDYTDSKHPDYTSYIMGGHQERRFSIPFKK